MRGKRIFSLLRLVTLLVAVVLLAGCSQQTFFERMMPKADVEFAKGYLALFPAGDFAAIQRQIDPGLQDPQLRPKLEQIAKLFPKEAPKSVNVVGWQTMSSGDTTEVNLTFEYEYSHTWILANEVHVRTGNEIVVKGIHAQVLKESLKETNRFTFAGKGPVHYGVLAAAIAVPLFILYVLVLAIRTPIPKRKWLWILFIIVGFVQISLDWSTGKLNVNPLYFQAFGAGFSKAGPYAPVLISTSIPLGAIIFLLRRKKWLAQPAEATEAVPAEPQPPTT